MARPDWPPEYVNSSINVLLDGGVPDAAYRLYNMLRALSWGDDTLVISFKKLMDLTGMTRTRIYEYARLLRLRRGLLSYAVRNDAFECSFIPVADRPEKRDLPSHTALSSKSPSKQEPKSKPIKAVNPEKRDKVNYYPLALALAEVCHMQLEPNRGLLFAEAKLLSKATPTPTPELLKQHYNGDPASFWRSRDWRGKAGENPIPSVIRKTWGQWGEPAPAAPGKYDALLRSLEEPDGDAD